jgi:hypothetical protein
LLGLDVGVPDTQHFRGAAPAWCSPCRWRTPIRGANDEIRTVMVRLLEAAQEDETLAPGLGIDQIVLLMRALGYGLARMAVDGHFPKWHAFEPPADAMPKALSLLWICSGRGRFSARQW